MATVLRLVHGYDRMPSVISAGRTKDDARDNVLDALRTMLAAPGNDIGQREVETVRAVLESARERRLGRQR